MTTAASMPLTTDAAIPAKSRRSRLRLDNPTRIRRELARLYAEARAGEREPVATRHLADILGLIAGLVGAGAAAEAER